MSNDSNSSTRTTYRGARLILGDGETVIENADLTISGGRIEHVGPADSASVSGHGAEQIVPVNGKTIMPALVDPHGHIGYMRGTVCDPRFYSRDNVIDHLRRLLYFGVSTFQSLGTDMHDTEITVRNDQRAGRLDDEDLAALFTAGAGLVAAPTADAASGAPFFAVDAVHQTTGPEDARAFVSTLAAKHVDAVKFWIDDRGGAAAKLSAETCRAIVDEAHRHGIKAAAHIYTLEDANTALDAGADILAHMPRDPEPDAALLARLHAANVTVFTSMSVQSPVRTEWLDEPIVRETLSTTARDEFRTHLEAQGSEPLFDTSHTFRRLQGNLAIFHEAGVHLVLSPDTGVFAQLPGIATHREMEVLVEAGLPALKAIELGTLRSSALLGLHDRGLLAEGRRADLLVLDGDPREDIRNTRRISSVVIGGRRIDRNRLLDKIASH